VVRVASTSTFLDMRFIVLHSEASATTGSSDAALRAGM
jgi:hypothetical protein